MFLEGSKIVYLPRNTATNNYNVHLVCHPENFNKLCTSNWIHSLATDGNQWVKNHANMHQLIYNNSDIDKRNNNSYDSLHHLKKNR